MAEMNRRSFVAGAAAVVSLVVLGDQFSFGQAARPPEQAGPPQVDIGKPEDFAKDAISTKFASSNKILIANAGGKIYAMTAVCTHRGSTINTLRDGKLRCPAHGSMFTIDGKVASGQAKSTLARHAITLNADGHLIVDKTRSFDEAKWGEPDASYTVKA